MTSRLARLTIRTVLLLLVVSLPVLAGPVNVFLQTAVDDSELTIRFATTQNPVPEDYLDGVGFLLLGPATITYQGQSITQEIQLLLMAEMDFFGIGITGPGGAFVMGGVLYFTSEEQLYSGPESAPLLKLGTFPVTAYSDFGAAAAAQGGVPSVYTATVTPEPGAFYLTAAGILALGAVLRLKRTK